MGNDVFDLALSGLTAYLGTPSAHESGTGARFRSARKGKATVYHGGIAAGNLAEIAFEPCSMANRLGMSETDFNAFVRRLRDATGRPIEVNERFKWPRVGMASPSDVELVLGHLRRQLDDPQVA